MHSDPRRSSLHRKQAWSQHGWSWIFALVAGLALRLWWVHKYPVLQGDPLIYGDIAKNLLLHGVYGLSDSGPWNAVTTAVTNAATNATHTAHPTLIRLPGYPLFLLACFQLFGLDHFRSALYVQVVVDLGSCVLLALTARRLWTRRAALATLWLAALCPFLATYVAAPLTETLEFFSISAALYAMVRLLGAERAARENAPKPELRPEPNPWRWTAVLAVSWSYAALLRPDGALLAVAMFPALSIYAYRSQGRAAAARMLRHAAVAALLSLLPFVLWTDRNWRTFHVFQPLAPRYATDPGEPTNPGFQRWTKTVCVDLACTQEIYWNLDSDPLDIATVPDRAFDTPEQYETTRQLFADYNKTTTLTDAMDARFAALADERIAAHPERFYLLLPLARVTDMWLRPRIELLPNDLRWWQYDEHQGETVFAWAWAALNLAYLVLAVWGATRKPKLLGMMLVFVLLRCALLATIEAPEPRYTLECFPMVFILAGVALGGRRRRRRKKLLPETTYESPASLTEP